MSFIQSLAEGFSPPLVVLCLAGGVTFALVTHDRPAPPSGSMHQPVP